MVCKGVVDLVSQMASNAVERMADYLVPVGGAMSAGSMEETKAF